MFEFATYLGAQAGSLDLSVLSLDVLKQINITAVCTDGCPTLGTVVCTTKYRVNSSGTPSYNKVSPCYYDGNSFLASALEDEFDFEFDNFELDQALKGAPSGGHTLAFWAWVVQRELNNQTCVIRLANYCPSCKKKNSHRRNGWSSLNDLTLPKCCHRCGHQFKS